MSNAVVFWHPGIKYDTELDLRNKVVAEVFEGKLGMSCSSVAGIHRIGRSSTNRQIVDCETL